MGKELEHKKYSYSIVIVTYNRLHMLKQCIEHAINQTLRPEALIIVDNASNDGTKEYLENIKDETEKGIYEGNIIVLREEENVGGAGGFYYGIKEAVENTESEWIFVIDDDAILDYDCCEKMNPKLYSALLSDGNAPAYACAVYCRGKLELNHRLNENKIVSEDAYKKKIFECTRTSFCGSMFHRSLIEKIGYPEMDYFLWSDDTEYSLRIKDYGKIAVCTKATLQHGDPDAPDRRAVVDWRYYYGTRNRIDMLKRHKKHWELIVDIAEIILIIMLRYIRMAIHVNDHDRYVRDKYEKSIYVDGLKDGLHGRLGRNPKYLPGKA